MGEKEVRCDWDREDEENRGKEQRQHLILPNGRGKTEFVVTTVGQSLEDLNHWSDLIRFLLYLEGKAYKQGTVTKDGAES